MQIKQKARKSGAYMRQLKRKGFGVPENWRIADFVDKEI
jgi:hypothetical protein